MVSGHQAQLPGGEAVTAEVVKRAERRAAEGRERAARAGLLAARSFEESALQHERVAVVQDRSVRQGVLDVDKHRESATLHRKAAAVDRKLAELKRKESEADLSFDTDQ
ncbi:MAG: hypothetical protein ACLP5J_25445 [Mycobacterium sp.]|uniref:hypothetical protein n=1 Tax=Mycobacterium sp. TaxID=1785 RepID=UPI003F974650